MVGGGGGGSSRGGGPAPQRSSCNINEDTDVKSPDPAVAKGVKVKDVLQVELLLDPKPRLALIAKSGNTLGGIVPRSLTVIIDCIRNQGRAYEALVKQIDGGHITVNIHLT